MPGHLSAACQTSRQHKCENASTLCWGIKPRQRSAGRPPPGPQTSPWPRSWLRTGRPSAPVERGASALAQVVAQDRAPVCPGGPGGQGDLAQVGAQDRAPVCPGGPGGKATWPRSGPRTGRPSAPVGRGARRPGPGRGPGPGAGLPRWTGGQGDLAQVGAQDRAPVCPGGAGGEEGLRFRRRMWCRNIQYGGPCEGGSANFQRRGARVSHPWVHGGQAGGVQPGAGPS